MRYTNIGFLQILCLVLLANANERNQPKQVKKRGVVNNFGEGLKLAGQVFGINTAADVANLVAMAFAKKKPDFISMFQQQQQANDGDSEPDASQQDNSAQEQQASNVKNGQRQKQQQQQEQEQDESSEQSREPLSISESTTKRFVTGVLRMIGFDATKLGALAINALIMIAQAIGNALTMPTRRNGGHTSYDGEDEGEPETLRNGEQGEHQPRALREGTPIDWYLENPNAGMRRMLGDALDSELTDRITAMIEHVEEQEGGQVGCIKLLMCKSSPIIWGMQRSVSECVTGKAANATDDGAETREKPKPKKLFSTEIFFTHFPTIEEFRKHGAACDERFHKQCNLDEDGDGDAEQAKKSKMQ